VIGPWFVRGRDRIWWVAFATMVLFYWFGSSTTSAYMPLPLSARLFAPVMPFVLVTATLACDAVVDRTSGSRWRVAIVVFFAVLFVSWQSAIRASLRHTRPETAAFAVLRDEVFADPNRRIVFVCTEPRCVPLADFYFGFAPPPNVLIEFVTDFAHAPKPTGVTVRALRGRETGVIDTLELPTVLSRPELRLYDAGDGTRLWNALQ
jgi:hypothetical protein